MSIFQIHNNVFLCFYRCSDLKTKELLTEITKSRKLFMVPFETNGKFNIRYCVIAERMEEKHILEAWNIIQEAATMILPSTGYCIGQ